MKQKAKAKKNSKRTPTKKILEQMAEPRPLPMGVTEFHEWSDRIISGALLPLPQGQDADLLVQSQKYALAQMIMHLGPTECHKPDAFFIHQLRKGAVNQVVYAYILEIDKAKEEKKKAEKAELEAKLKNEADTERTETDSD